MSGEIEAAGDLITGTARSRAVEPSAGEAGPAAYSCLNCGAKLAGTHCYVCGQKAEVHRTLGAFWHDFTHSILHFEGKIWRTLPLLAFKPGELTRRYVHGERARFVSPLALFLFSVFLMFAVFSAVGLPVQVDPALRNGRAGAEGQKSLGVELATARQRIASFEKRRRELSAARQPTAELDARLATAREQARAIETGIALAKGFDGGLVVTDGLRVDSGSKTLDSAIRHAAANPQLLLYKMQSNGYKFSWALILLSLPFVWLVFAWKRQFHLFDHLIFVTYSLCFVTLLLVTMSLLTAVGLGGIAPLLMVFGFPLNLFAQLRGAYGLSFVSALWRAVVLFIAAVLVLLLFGLVLLAVGVS